VLVTLHQAKSQLLSRREWGSFASVSSELLAQLSELERTAIKISESGRPDAEKDEWDPYKELNVPRGVSLDQLQRVYHSLVHVYHEAKDTHDPEKWKRINAAYTQICSDLKRRD
jgi:DnaJ-class molecular chaperone